MADYEMKDLGYPRTPTTARLRVEMPDGSLWDVPVQVIADSRDAHNADEQEDTIASIYADGLGNYEIMDWAANNMNWDDVQDYAAKVELPQRRVDFQEGWMDGEKQIVGKI